MDLLAERRAADWRATAEVRRDNYRCMVSRWQAQWSGSDKGRYTYDLFPSVEERLRMKFLEVNHYTAQALSGHGAFREYLARRTLVDSPECPECGERDTALHALVSCEEAPAPSPECIAIWLHVYAGSSPITVESYPVLVSRSRLILTRRKEMGI